MSSTVLQVPIGNLDQYLDELIRDQKQRMQVRWLLCCCQSALHCKPPDKDAGNTVDILCASSQSKCVLCRHRRLRDAEPQPSTAA